MKPYYITFRSITPAQRGERVLRRMGLDCLLQRTPRRLEEKGCGYCLRIRGEEALSALEQLRSKEVAFSKFYLQGENGTMTELPI